MNRETSPEMFKHLCISHWLTDSKYMETPLKCHLHKPKQIGGEEFLPLPRKWLTITDSANGSKVLLVTISKAGCNFWLVVVGMSLCRGKELPVVPSRSGVENGAEETAASC